MAAYNKFFNNGETFEQLNNPKHFYFTDNCQA